LTRRLRLLDLGEVEPLRSQGLYHGLARAMTERTPDTLVLCWPSRRYLSVGFHQDPEAELDLALCREAGYPVFHRSIGGGTVLLDDRQLFYQVILHASRAPLRIDAIYERWLAGPVEALNRLGLPARLVGTNEIEVRRRRIAGTGGGQIGQAMVLTGNLLLDFPYDEMIRLWRLPAPAFRTLAAEALRGSVTTLRRELDTAPPIEQLARLVVRSYEDELGQELVRGSLDPAEQAAVAEAERRLQAPFRAPEGGPRCRALKIARGLYVGEESSELGRRAVLRRDGSVESWLPLAEQPGPGADASGTRSAVEQRA
jgi:lipoate-protein ligase A